MPYLCNMANNHVYNGLVSGFSKKSKQEKIEWISQTCFASPQLAKSILETYWHTDEKLQRLHDEFIENAVSNFYLPMESFWNLVSFWLVSAPMRARFGINCRLTYYTTEVLSTIVERSADILNISITNQAAIEIAGRSRGTPRIANALLRRIRDFAQIKGDGSIDMKIAKYGLEALHVDAHGLDEMDNKILSTMMDKFKGGPVGISTLATAVSESAETLEEVYEPFLIQEGFIVRTPRGREVTDLAYRHLGRTKSSRQGDLF